MGSLSIFAFQNCAEPQSFTQKSSSIVERDSCQGLLCNDNRGGPAPTATPAPTPVPPEPTADDYSNQVQVDSFRWNRSENQNHVFSANSNEIAEGGYEADYQFEGVAFRLFQSALGSSLPINRCYRADVAKHFLTTTNDCEGSGATNEGTLGYIASQPSVGAQFPLYRCFNSNLNAHLTTAFHAECVDNGYSVEGIMGYIRFNQLENTVDGVAKSTMFRLYENGIGDHMMSSDQNEAADTYSYEGLSHQLSSSNLGQMRALHRCYRVRGDGNNDHYMSLDSNCEGAGQFEGVLGYVSTIPLSGMSQAIYRCVNTVSGNHFTTTSDNCEGAASHNVEGLLGYIVNN